MTALASTEPTAANEPVRPRGPAHLLAPLAVVLLAAAGVAGIYRVAVRTSLGQTVDTTMMRGADVHHPKVVEVLDRTLNGTTFASLVLVCIVAATVGLLRRRLDLAIGAALMVIGANASVQLLKTQLPRPDLDGFGMPNSFPSGHTAAAASVAFALIMVLPRGVRGTVSLAGFGYVTVIAIATVWAAWHRPSDTVAGLLVVLAWGALAVFGIRVRRLRTAAVLQRPSRVATLPLLAIGVVTAVAGGLGGGAVVLSERVTTHLVPGRFAFLAGAAAITAVVSAAFLVWVRLAAGDRPAPTGPDDLNRSGTDGAGGTEGGTP